MPKRIQLRRGCAYYSSRDVWDDGTKRDDEVEYIRADLASTAPSLAAAPAIAGALFDFAGYLTSLPQPVTLGASEWSAPAVDALTKWAAKRGLSLDDAEVLGWQNLLAPAAPSEKGKEQ